MERVLANQGIINNRLKIVGGREGKILNLQRETLKKVGERATRGQVRGLQIQVKQLKASELAESRAGRSEPAGLSSASTAEINSGEFPLGLFC